MDGINIPAQVAEAAEVPGDLDSSQVGPYRFPTPARRRTAAAIYGVLAVSVLLLVPNRPVAFAMTVIAALLAVWHWLAAWPLRLQAEEALALAAPRAPFPIGHASAAIIFSGWRSRPRWHVVLYDATDPPAARALVVVDGVDGQVIGDTYTEALPQSD